MGRTIQFESHTELGAIYVMEHDPGVLEYCRLLVFKEILSS
jgi:hypothetical protein